MNPLWHLHLLGQLRACRDGQVITDFSTQQTGILLACLAVRLGQPCSRSELGRQMWPDEEPRDTAKRLRTALWALRQMLEPEGVTPGTVLSASHRYISLSAEAGTTDVAAFWEARRAAGAARSQDDREHLLRRAATLYTSALLPGCQCDWIEKERRALQRASLDVLSALTASCREAGNLVEALDWARRRTEADPYQEEAWHDLMSLHEQRGHPVEACRVFREFERVLRGSGLGVHPGPEITALMAHLQAREGTTAPPPAVRQVPAVAAEGTPARSGRTTLPKRLRVLGALSFVVLLAAGALTGPGAWRAVRQSRAEAHARHLCDVGRAAWNERSEDGYRRADAAFTAALAVAPRSAPALSGLADTVGLQGYYGWAEPRGAFAEDEELAGRALAAARDDQERAQAYTSLGWADMMGWRWPEAQKDFQAALQYDPEYPTAHQWYSLYLMVTGDWADSHSQVGLAEGLDMTSPVIAKSLAQRYYYTGDYRKAVAYGLEACHRNPEDALSALWLGLAYEQERDYVTALHFLDRALQLSGGRDVGAWAALGHADAVSGRVTQATQALADLRRLRAGGRYVSSAALATVEAGLFDATRDPRWKRLAIADLRRALPEHAGELILLGVEPRFRALRTDPAFTDLLQTIRLPALNPPFTARQSRSSGEERRAALLRTMSPALSS